MTDDTPKLQARVTRLTLVPEGDPIYSERAIDVQIVDDAAGEYVVVTQDGTPKALRMEISPDEWPALRAAINRMIRQCVGEE